ncbi:hypothetical protein [Tateyamaria sp.]|uniref:hypothetical protein n=1 Tax=Tateyamaria sp. TaxID=1929288 RepID=UPI0032A06585
MTRRSMLFTGPYLAMWLWLIVPLALHGLVPFVPAPAGHVTVHVGGWMEEIENADNFGDALRIMRKDRSYHQCRYVRFTPETTTLLVLPPKQQHCSFLRLTRPNTGHVVRSVSNAEFIDILKRTY